MSMSVLIYVRKHNKELFTKIAMEVFGDCEISYYSDFKGLGNIWTGDYIYSDKYDKKCDLNEDDINDIKYRDRSLRGNLKEQADKLIVRLWNGVFELFERERYDYLFSLSIDCYSIDILYRVANLHNVRCISFLGSFLRGYCWFTLRGERNELNRHVSREEVEHVLNSLTKREYIPRSESKNIKRTKKDVYYFFFRRKLIEELYYPCIRVLKRDPYNFHYNMHNFVNGGIKDYYNSDYYKYFTPINSIRIDRKLTVYMPLHLIPEATTDYWCTGISKMGYENYIVSVIKNAEEGIKFIIKEHPAMFGKRRLSFYEKLTKMKNVFVIHPLERSNELLEYVDTVVVDNGTVGVEAALRGKRVLALNKNYYCDLNPNVHLVERISKDNLNIPIVELDNYLFIEKILSGLFVSDYMNSVAQGKSNVKQITNGIKLFMSANNWEE